MLEEELEELRALLAGMPEGVAIYELDGRVHYLNSVSERMLGTTLAEVRGKPLFDLLPGAIDNEFHDAFQRVAAGGGTETFEHYYAPWDTWFNSRVSRVGVRVHVVARETTVEVRRRRRIETLARISEVFTGDELAFVAATERIAAILADVLAAHCSVALVSADGVWLERVASSTEEPATREPLVARWRADIGHSGEALRTRSAVLADQSSLLAVPLLVADEAVGVLLATRPKDARPLTSDERGLAMSIAPSVGLYLAHARRHAEAVSLRQRLSKLADALPALVAFVDRDQRYVYVNAAYAHWFQAPRESFLGRTLAEVAFEGAYSRIEPFVRRALAGQAVRFQGRFDYPSAARDIDVQYFPIGTPGQADGFAVLVQDMTTEQRVIALEREQLEAERRDARRLESLLALAGKLGAASSPDEVARVVVDGGAGALDATMAAMFALSEDGREIVLSRQRGFSPEQVAAFTRIPLAQGGPVVDAITSGRAVWITSREEYLARYPLMEPSHRPADAPPIAFAMMPYQILGGARGCIAFVFHDERRLTAADRTYLEVLASHSAEALRRAHLFEDARRARREAEAANRAKDEFLAILGHELRNPLAPIATALELMQARQPTALVRERETIERQVEHLSRLVDDLLDVSRITRGQVELRRERQPLSALVARAIELTRPLLESRRHRLTVDVPETLTVFVDPTRLSQVLANLLSNAAKYTPPGGHIGVHGEHAPDCAVLFVRDDGVGIDREMLPRIFDIFVQAPQPSARTDGGLGIGLAIVRSLVEAHGGSVEARSEGAGKGTELIIRLPAPTIPASMPEPAPISVPRPSPARRILVVDDNEDGAILLSELLRLHGHEVQTAHDGQTALEIADTFRPDLAILDLGLPGMDGYELALRLRSARPLQLIAVTGYGRQSDHERTRQAGFAAHLAKPVRLEALLPLVESNTSEPSSSSSPRMAHERVSPRDPVA